MDGQLGHPGPLVELLRLGPGDAGELFTLQRASYISEARLHQDFDLPPLVEPLEGVQAALIDPACLVWGVRESGRLLASVRFVIRGEVAEIGRLVVAPDQQGRGLGSSLLLAAEDAVPPSVSVFRLFTGSLSVVPLKLYPRLGYRETHRSPEADHELVHFEKERSPR
ncbi:GNAT family N-acetyltransferase [Amycolatopsis sp. H20-H5]|uniref:GNAT family N-acetyltransferase n=1 Tax=Amycolatopsis sp. H20-H5 TaxID=3046309 RepID=UPI002DB70BC1|nr:GNAT family N-acetyltransferase [Amycolatopsis sp. H20-H5]MEC3979588.1 GNAT family N-acetyltransferase [Amycolatopsis sp. H20-H5]